MGTSSCSFQKLVLLLAVLFTAFCGAQTKSQANPDLSGTWILNVDKSDLRVWIRMTPEKLVIRQSGKEIHFDRELKGKHSSISYNTDGREQNYSSAEHPPGLVRAHWGNGALIVEESSDIRVGVRSFEDREKTTIRWVLSEDGGVLTEKNNERKTTAVYLRQR